MPASIYRALVVGALAIAACRRDSPPPAAPPAAAPKPVEKTTPFPTVALVEIADGGWRSTDLPPTWAEYERLRDSDRRALPPSEQLRARLCGGDVAQLEQLLALARDAAKKQYHLPTALGGYLECNGGPLCPDLYRLYQAEKLEPVKDFIFAELIACTPSLPSAQRVDEALIAHTLRLNGESHWPVELSQPAADAFARVAKKNWPLIDSYLGPFDRPLGSLRGERVAPLLLQLHALAPNAKGRRHVVGQMFAQTEPKTAALYAKQCGPGTYAPVDCVLPNGNSLSQRALDDDLRELTSEKSRDPELLAALEACVLATQGLREIQCFLSLGAADFRRAQQLVPNLGTTRRPPLLTEAAALLASGKDFAAARAALAERGLSDAESHVEQTVLAREIMVATHHAQVVDLEYQRTAGELLPELAMLAGSPLRDVRFAETPYAPWNAETKEQFLELRALVDGKTLGTRYTNAGWHEPFVLTGFLNALAERRGSDVRWLPLTIDGQYVTVAIGSVASLSGAVQAGLLTPATRRDVDSALDYAGAAKRAFVDGPQ